MIWVFMDKTSYALGMSIGRQLSQMGAEGLSVDDFALGLGDVLAGRQQLSDGEAQAAVSAFFAEQEQRQRSEAAQKGKKAKAEGERYLADNAAKEGVKVLPSGLQYLVLSEGKGRKPKATDRVRCHYEGMLIDGTMFDSSLQRGEPATFPLNGVIAGWTEGLQLMSEGSKYRFFIPYQLGYGASGAGSAIPPYAALIFDVELIKVL